MIVVKFLGSPTDLCGYWDNLVTIKLCRAKKSLQMIRLRKVMRHQTTGWMFTAANVCNAVTVMTHDS